MDAKICKQSSGGHQQEWGTGAGSLVAQVLLQPRVLHAIHACEPEPETTKEGELSLAAHLVNRLPDTLRLAGQVDDQALAAQPRCLA